jgi:hypothetical protein
LEERLAPASVPLLVTSLADSGPGTLRATVASAAPGDSIDFSVSGTVHLTTGEITIAKDLTISGVGATVTVDGLGRDRLFEVAPGNTVTIDHLTLTNGYARLSAGSSAPAMGGAILNAGDLTLDTDTIDDNRAAGSGGAVETKAPMPGAATSSVSLTVLHCVFRGNRAIAGGGGAISTYDPMPAPGGGGSVAVSVTSSTFEGNNAYLAGGAIDFTLYSHSPGPSGASSLTVDDSTFQSNEGATGGGIYYGSAAGLDGGTWTMTVTHSTFNTDVAFGVLPVGGNGGGIAVQLVLPTSGTATVLISGSDFDGNWSGSGGGISLTIHTGGSSTAHATIDQDSVAFNQAVQGGGMYALVDGESTDTEVYLTNSTVDDNVASSLATGTSSVSGAGGGLFASLLGNPHTLFAVVNCTVAYNSAVTSTSTTSSATGGGISLFVSGSVMSSPMVLLNSLTVAYNYADGSGGGLLVVPGSVAPWVRNCAFDLNAVGSGGSGPDVSGSVTSDGFNILSDGSGSSGFSDPTDVTGAGDLMLDTQLLDNGGPTLTLLPLSGSPVIGTGFFIPVALFGDPATDQRGVLRATPTSRGAVDPP